MTGECLSFGCSAEKVEVHILLFFFLHNLFGLGGRSSASATATSGCSTTTAATAAKLQELRDVFSIADLGKEGWEKRIDLASSCLNELVEVVLCNVNTRVCQDHARIGAEQLILLCLWHFCCWNLSHGALDSSILLEVQLTALYVLP